MGIKARVKIKLQVKIQIKVKSRAGDYLRISWQWSAEEKLSIEITRSKFRGDMNPLKCTFRIWGLEKSRKGNCDFTRVYVLWESVCIYIIEINLNIYTLIYTCIYIHLSIYVSICMHVCMYVSMYGWIYYMYQCIICINIYICISVSINEV